MELQHCLVTVTLRAALLLSMLRIFLSLQPLSVVSVVPLGLMIKCVFHILT